MLYLYQSNRLETLAEFYAAMTRAVPPENPLAPETVIVQSRGMGRWLTFELARYNGIAANIDFVLPAAFAWRLMRQTLDNAPALSPFSPDVLTWQLFSLLPALDAPVYQPLKHYLQAGSTPGQSEGTDNAAFELAGKLADIFDQYLVYRPDWLTAWETGQRIGLGHDEDWQASLWQSVSADIQAPHRAAMLHQTLNRLDTITLPQRITLFGIASLAPGYLSLIKRLAELTDVCLFTLNPCQEYWGDIVDARTQATLAAKGDQAATQGHPLLASMGKQGRDFFELISADTELDSRDLFALPTSSFHDTAASRAERFQDAAPAPLSLLVRLQQDILTLNKPDSTVPAHNDNSIVIHAVHSPLRELEILKDQLLDRLAADPTLTPADIAVLTPDIQTYAPFIHAVFGAHNNTPAIPYSIADCHVTREHPLLAAFAALLDLLDSRFIVDDVLALLDSTALRRRFEFCDDDLLLIHRWIDSAAIRWGRDAAQRSTLGLPDEPAYSWRNGLDRLLLGSILPAELLNDRTPLFHGLLPVNGSGNDAALARFATLFDTLFQLAEDWQHPADANTWVTRLLQAQDQLFSPDGSENTALSIWQEALSDLTTHTGLANFDQPFGLTVLRDWLKRRLMLSVDAGFLNGGVTFCAMVPMRNLPFRVLCLIGLNDGVYPRDERPVSFDLIARHPQRGDRSRRDDDRYLFLEALLSARETLYLSYIGHSLRSNDPLPPSALVSELLDCLQSMGVNTTQLITEHPLQPFSPRYFDHRDQRLFSYDPGYIHALQSPLSTFPPFSVPVPQTDTHTHIIWRELLDFWHLPARAWLHHQLNLSPAYVDRLSTEHEPFTLDYRSEHRIRETWIDSRLQQQSATTIHKQLSASGLLPPGKLGEEYADYERDMANRLPLPDSLKQPVLPPQRIQFLLNEYQITGTLPGLRNEGYFLLSTHTHSARDTVDAWLTHLLLNCLRLPAITPQTTLIDSTGSRTLPGIPQDEAMALLRPWLQYWQTGQQKPLPFFIRSSLAAAELLSEKSSTEQAISKAQQKWAPSYDSTKGESQNPAIQLAFRHQSPLNDPLFLSLAELLIPMLKHLAQTI